MPPNNNAMRHGRDDARRLEVDGDVWFVYEVGPAYDRRSSSLVFESEALVRRVGTYPAHWRDLTDADLALLMDRL